MPLLAKHDAIVIDTICLINFQASKHLESIISSIRPIKAIVHQYVAEKEVQYVNDGPIDNPTSVKRPFDCIALAKNGILQIEYPPLKDISSTVLMLTAGTISLDNGEAFSAATAYHNNWALATDDHKAIYEISRLLPEVTIITTAEMIYYWAHSTDVADDTIAHVLHYVEIYGNYTIAKHFPPNNIYRQWWESITNTLR